MRIDSLDYSSSTDQLTSLVQSNFAISIIRPSTMIDRNWLPSTYAPLANAVPDKSLNRSQKADSMLTFEAEQHQGPASIVEKLQVGCADDGQHPMGP